MRRQGNEIGADHTGIEGDLSCGLDSVTMEQRATRSRDRADRSHRLHHTGLVVGKHYRDERPARIPGEKSVERVEHYDTVMVDRDALGLGNRTEDRIMLYSRNQDTVAPGT